MRVLHLIHNLAVAGAEVLVRNLLLGLTRRGIDCELYLLCPVASPLQDSLRSNAIKIHAPSPVSPRSPTHVRALALHFRSSAYDVIHVHLFPAQLWAALAAVRAGINAPLVTTEHCAYNYRRRRIYRPLDRWMYAQYRSIACVTDDTAKALIAWLPETAAKVRTCPNGIDLEVFRSAMPAGRAEGLGVPDGCPVVLSVGRLVHQKDHATVIRALAQVGRAHLVIIGTGPDLPGHQQLATKLGLSDRVHFLGARTDVAPLMKAADVFVQSSRFEGFGIAALEAMASGLPVIASRVAGLTELVGEAGMLFDPGDISQLAAHLTAILGDSQLRACMVRRGYDRASQFSLENTLGSYESLYHDLLAHKMARACFS